LIKYIFPRPAVPAIISRSGNTTFEQNFEDFIYADGAPDFDWSRTQDEYSKDWGAKFTETLQKMIDVVNLYSNEYDLYINMSKTKFVIFRNRGNCKPEEKWFLNAIKIEQYTQIHKLIT
jgi:hypothetical protein